MIRKNKRTEIRFTTGERRCYYLKYELFNAGDRIKHISYGKGIVLESPGVGYVVKFDDGKVRRITDGMLKAVR